MRLLLRDFGYTGGIETTNIHLVREFTQQVELLVWVMPRSRFDYFQQFLPSTDRLIYATDAWPRKSRLQEKLASGARHLHRQKNVPARFASRGLRQALSDMRLKRLIREHKITHCLWSWILHVDPPRVAVPLGAMVMDIRWRHLPETFCGCDVNSIERQFCRWLKRSDIVFPVSDVTAADVKRFYPWYTGPIRVVPHAAREPGSNGKAIAPLELPPGRPFFYYPAIAHAHKNHLTLFDACAKLFAKGYDFDLVLTGAETEHFDYTQPNDEEAIEPGRALLRKEEAFIRGRVKPLGYCGRPEVQALYEQCTAVVLPSFFEGFGLTLTEALEYGAEIICSDIPAHREQLTRYECTDSVSVISPNDPTAWAVEMEKVLLASRNGASQKSSAPPRLERWTWKDAAAAYVESLSALRADRAP